MKTILILIIHVGFDAAFGWSLLSLRPHSRNAFETTLAAVLLGMYLETLSTGTLMFLGLSLTTAGILTAIGMLAVLLASSSGARSASPIARSLMEGRAKGPGEGLKLSLPLKWYEWAALAAIAEKLLFATWQLARFDTYFDDALMHWSGRARSLYGSVNWSLDSASPFFMGKHIGNGNYPLLLVIWRALSAEINGEWNEVISRADGLIFFLVIVGTVWAAVWKFSKTRWLAAAAAFVVSAVPLLVWHAAAGYSDIAVEAFIVAAFAAILRGEWLTSGIMAAAAIWSKNDGLVLYLPAFFLAIVLIRSKQDKMTLKWPAASLFLLGFLTVAPWLIFNYTHSLGITPGQQKLVWHSDAPKLLWTALTGTAPSGILWVCILSGVIYISRAMFGDRFGRALILAFTLTFLAIVFLFTSTSAYVFLADQTTIHRVLMQFSAGAILIVTYGLSLKMRSGIADVDHAEKRR